jgi:hypothetical protein
MIAELAIANAAFGVIKETIANGGDIMAAGQHIFKFFDSKSELTKKANKSGQTQRLSLLLNRLNNMRRLSKSCSSIKVEQVFGMIG